MRTKWLLAICCSTLGLLAGWLIGRLPALKPNAVEESSHALAPAPAAAPTVMPEPRKPDPEFFKSDGLVGKPIPLSEVYSTVRQRGLKGDPFRGDPALSEEYNSLLDELYKLGTPLMFVVRAPTVYSALSESLAVLTRVQHVTEVSNQWRGTREEPRTAPFWAFVFLGTESGTPYWLLDGVSRTDSSLTVKYSLALFATTGKTMSVHAYWIPLDDLPTGPFTLRLHNNDQEADTLVFRTVITRVKP